MIYCRNCGFQVEDGSAFCPKCRFKLETPGWDMKTPTIPISAPGSTSKPKPMPASSPVLVKEKAEKSNLKKLWFWLIVLIATVLAIICAVNVVILASDHIAFKNYYNKDMKTCHEEFKKLESIIEDALDTNIYDVYDYIEDNDLKEKTYALYDRVNNYKSNNSHVSSAHIYYVRAVKNMRDAVDTMYEKAEKEERLSDEFNELYEKYIGASNDYYVECKKFADKHFLIINEEE